MDNSQNLIRVKELDSLRGIAAVCVLICHMLFMKKGFEGIHSLGYFGVGLFFIISGFVIDLTLSTSKSVFHFIVNRISRLYPTYWLSIIIINILSFILNKGKIVSLKQTLVNITMLQKYFGITDLDGTYWTLHIELSFYLITIISITILTKYIFKRKIITDILFFIFFSALSLAGYFKITSSSISIINNFLPVLTCYSYFFAGTIFYKLYQFKEKSYFLLTFLSLIIGILTIPQFGNVQLQHIRYEYYIIMIIIIYIIFYLLVYKHLSFLNNKILLFFGKISYSLYITHFWVSFCFLIPFLESRGINWIVTRFITVFIVITLAWLANRFIEVPSMNAIRNLFFRKTLEKA